MRKLITLCALVVLAACGRGRMTTFLSSTITEEPRVNRKVPVTRIDVYDALTANAETAANSTLSLLVQNMSDSAVTLTIDTLRSKNRERFSLFALSSRLADTLVKGTGEKFYVSYTTSAELRALNLRIKSGDDAFVTSG